MTNDQYTCLTGPQVFMIPSKNRYYKHSRISEAKFRQVLKCFAMDLTATETSQLSAISVRSINSIYLKLRARLVELCNREATYPQAQRITAETANGVEEDDPVQRYLAFGIIRHEGRVYTEMASASTRRLMRKPRGLPDLDAIINDPDWKGYDGLVDVKLNRLYRIDAMSSIDKSLTIVDTFWTFAKKRLMQFNGIHRHTFYLHLKETEYRFNHRQENIYKLLLNHLRTNPI